MDTEIISVQNPRVKQWSMLLTKRGRDQQHKFLLEGHHLVQEALKAGQPVETVLYALDKGYPEPLRSLSGPDTEWVGVSAAVLAKCSETQTPQNVLAVCRKSDVSAVRLMEQSDALIVAVDGVQDPGNLGTIIRSADAVGATAVILGKGTVDLYNPKTVRSTMGSLFHLPIAEADLRELLPQALKQGIQVIGTRLDAKATCYAADLRRATWILVGNEGAGVSPDLAEYVTQDVIIPMRGQAESLNVAMAATVLLYEAMRQRYFCTNKNS